ncbi:MAG: DUF2062 domain-containing protein [Opitutaceae bacterium]
MPRRTNIHRYPILKLFSAQARKRPYLWSFRQAEVSVACYAGAVMAFLPTYGFQIPLALLAAVAFRANLPVMIAIQFITNPVTIAPLYLTTLKVGEWLIQSTGLHPHGSRVGAAAYALVLGGIVCGLATGLVLDLVYRFILYEKQILIKPPADVPENKPSASGQKPDSAKS